MLKECVNIDVPSDMSKNEIQKYIKYIEKIHNKPLLELRIVRTDNCVYIKCKFDNKPLNKLFLYLNNKFFT